MQLLGIQDPCYHFMFLGFAFRHSSECGMVFVVVLIFEYMFMFKLDFCEYLLGNFFIIRCLYILNTSSLLGT